MKSTEVFRDEWVEVVF